MNKVGTEVTYKIVVKMKRRADGGLRAWSDQVPGLVLSHKDPARVLADIEPALVVILEEQLGCAVKAERLSPMPVFGAHMSLAQRLKSRAIAMLEPAFDFIDRRFDHALRRMEYAAHPCNG